MKTEEDLQRQREAVRRWNASHPGLAAQRTREARAKNPEYFRDAQRRRRAEKRDHINALRRESEKRNPLRNLYHNAKANARRKGLPFDIELSDLTLPDVCPVLGIKLIRGDGARTDASPSIDKIIPALGYVKGNVIVVSWKANRIKNDANAAELLAVAEFYSRITTAS